MENSIIKSQYDQVMEMALARKEPVSQMARKANLKQAWLQRFLAGRYNSPGIDKVIKLERYLMTVPATGSQSLETSETEFNAR